MAEVTKKGDMIVIGDDQVRIEQGFKRFTATATEELLDDARTASHYQAGKPDAMGVPIVLGEKHTFIEWGGKDHPAQPCLYVYQRRELTPEEREARKTSFTYIFEQAGEPFDADEAGAEAALAFGQSLLGG